MRTKAPPGENCGLLSGSVVRRDDILTGPSDMSRSRASHSNSPGGMAEPGNRSMLAAVLGSIGTIAIFSAFVSYGSSDRDAFSLLRAPQANILGDDSAAPLPVLGSHHHFHEKLQEEEEDDTAVGNATNAMPTERCEWVVDLFTKKYKGRGEEELKTQYAIQSADSNVFYRATANIFWIDFVKNGWHDRIRFKTIGIQAKQFDGTPLQPRSTWTWVTGDQHLSNFGAWRNRGGEVVFSVNDFDVSSHSHKVSDNSMSLLCVICSLTINLPFFAILSLRTHSHLCRRQPFTTFKSMFFVLPSRFAAMLLPMALTLRIFTMFCEPSRTCTSRLSLIMSVVIESYFMS